MIALITPLRNKLESTIKAARDLAEEAARAALEQMGVSPKEKPPWLDDAEARLRVRLRAHGRQLGDVRRNNGVQEIEHLVTETAYEHWHRMLFARFLAENHLLMHPDGVPVSLQDCEDLAHDEGAHSGWELAGRYASRMLPQVFRPDSPVLEIHLAPEHQKGLEKLLSDLPSEVFTASDSLGWVYQFWQAKRKDEVNKSEVKIGAHELPAVTQLFTEDYMVQFLLHNSLGAWWVANHSGKTCPVELTYLRTLEDGTPAAGTFEGWPKRVADLKMLDPCTGSGHFLFSGFYMLVPMRMEEEGLSAQDACDAVLRDNLFGLEIDSRCIEIAAFNLALAAWTYPQEPPRPLGEGRGEGIGFRPLPEMNLACCGLPVSASKEEWVAFANGDKRLGEGMAVLYKLFNDAPILGSLINPHRFVQGDLVTAGYEELKPLLEKALEQENGRGDADRLEIGVAAQGLAKAAHLLGERYHLVATNVPYLVQGKQCPTLKSFCEQQFHSARYDLATVFIIRCREFLLKGGICSFVSPQSWIYLQSYKRFRENLLTKTKIKILAKLGAGAFGSISGEVVKATLCCLEESTCSTSDIIRGINVSDRVAATEKSARLVTDDILSIKQSKQKANPDSRILFGDIEASSHLSEFCTALAGSLTGDSAWFVRQFWEIPVLVSDWRKYQSTVRETCLYGGLTDIIFWEDGKGDLFSFAESVKHLNHVAQNWRRGSPNWERKGVMVSLMGQLPAALYNGDIYDCNCCAIVPNQAEDLEALWVYCLSEKFCTNVRKLDQSIKLTNATLLKIEFDYEYWQKVASEEYPNGLPKPYSDDPTQWIFHGHPATSTAPLQVAVARLLGYRWPSETDEGMELAPEARALIVRCRDLDLFTDDDGIVCIPAVRGEKPATEKLLALLAAAYGEAWGPTQLADLLGSVDCAGKSLEVWLRDKFFEQHFKLFHHRPFIWHIWDGQRDGFSALLNFHKLTRQNMEKLIYTYLGDWINRQEDGVKQGIDGAQVRLLAAKKLKADLEKILEGESPYYDIFVRWKPLHEQPIGWDPDLNDGVRLNIRPFMTAGFLRKNPNIKWNKDRGKDVESAPWFHKFQGDRINDFHLSLAEKKAAREQQ